MLTAEQITQALKGIDATAAVWILAHVANGRPLEAQRLLLAHLPTDQWDWGKELVASLNREHVLNGGVK